MRGAFVACFGDVDRHALESAGDAHRWHRGTAAYHEAHRFAVAVRADSRDGPHVEVRNGKAMVVHGDTTESREQLQRVGRRFAVVESDGEQLQAARDPVGLAPLFYRAVGRSLWLATEVSPLVALAPVAPDLEALSAQAAIVPHDARTGFEGIHRLLPGHTLHVDRDLLVEQRRYWDPYAFFGSFRGDRREARAELWARLLGAVDRCSLDGQVGILLSGGLDSAAVTAAAGRLRRPISPVHVAFEGVADAAEERFAQESAASAHAELAVVAGNAAPWHPEEDLGVSVIPYLTPPAYTANAGLAHLSASGVTAALDGNDGDGLFGVRGREWGELLMTRSIRRLGELAAAYGVGTVARGIAHDVIPPRVFDILRRRPAAPPNYLQHSERYFDPALHGRIRSIDHERWRPPLGEWRWRQVRQVLPVTTARMEEHELRGARYGIDIRHPFADRDLVEFAISLPAAIKSDPMRSKSLLRDALAGHAPDAVVQRIEKPEYLSILDRRVDRAACLTWIEESGIRLPFVNYERLFRDGLVDAPVFLLLMLARVHVFAASM